MKTALLFAFLVSLAAAPLAHGQIKATSTFRPDGTTASTVTDPEQGTSIETITDKNNKVLQKTTFLLDEKSNAIGAIRYNAAGVVRYKETYQHDLDGRIVEMKFTDANGQSLGRRVFNYSGNKLLGIDDYDAQGVLMAKPKPASSSAARPDKKKK